MVDRQLKKRGITDPRVLEAMAAVPRHAFVPRDQRHNAYVDAALPLSDGQTISQPLMVATAVQALELKPDDKVLEVGAGSGYQAAVMGALCQRVYAIEVLAPLAERARAALEALNIDNVRIVVADGNLGLPEFAPYDAIAVSAAAARMPPALIEQLAEGGRLVMPVGGPDGQTLVKATKQGDQITETAICSCIYVPLVDEPAGLPSSNGSG